MLFQCLSEWSHLCGVHIVPFPVKCELRTSLHTDNKRESFHRWKNSWHPSLSPFSFFTFSTSCSKHICQTCFVCERGMKVSRFRSHYPRKRNKPVTQAQHSLLSLETVVPISYGPLGSRPCISVGVVGVRICRERKHGLNLPGVPVQLGRQFRYPKSGRPTPGLGLAEAVERASRVSEPQAETRGAGHVFSLCISQLPPHPQR